MLLFQPLGTVAFPASPRLGAVLIPTLPPIVGVLNFSKLEVLFPIRPLLFERRRAVANLHPTGRAIGRQSRVLHVPEIFAFRNGAFPQGSVFNRLEQFLFPTRFQFCPYQITHIF